MLLLLDGLPHDRSSGAARTTKTICEMLAASGQFEVRALATTVTETGSIVSAEGLQADFQANFKHEPSARNGEAAVLSGYDRNIHYTLLATETPDWEKPYGAQFDRLLAAELDGYTPAIILTYGGRAEMVGRWIRARATLKLKVVFAVWNHGYLNAGQLFAQTDAILTPSQFLTDKYHRVLGINSTPLPTPIDLDDVRANNRDPVFCTFVNPAPEKGLMVVARLAEELGQRRPDIPLLVVESRGTAGNLVVAGLRGGFDLRRHENVMISQGAAKPKDIFAVTRVLLAPSLWSEPSGRVVSEALINGVPPIVSDRGGLPEEARGAGFVLSIPQKITPLIDQPVSADIVDPWIRVIEQLVDNEAAYQKASQQAAQAGKAYMPQALTPRYVAWFQQVLAQGQNASTLPRRLG